MTATKLAELPDVLTISEAAGVLRIGQRQLRQLINRHELYAARIGRSVRIPRASIETFLAGPRNDDDHQPTRLAVVEGRGHRS
jgi:excisionase family DNA binding protein